MPRRPSVSRSRSNSTQHSFEFYGFSPSSSPDVKSTSKPQPHPSSSSASFDFYGFSPSSSPEHINSSLPRQRTTRFPSSRPPIPSRSASTDSNAAPNNTHAYPDHTSTPQPQPHVPANAFNIMHEWEIESLEKWQRRLEQVRANQATLRSRINDLIREEKDLWAKYDSLSGGNSSTYHPSLRKRGPAAGEYAEWVAFLEAEVASLREELSVTTEAEEKAEKGVRRATARLAEIRSLGGKWKTTSGSPPATPPRSRSGSSSSAAPAPTSRSTSPGEQRRPHPPSRSNTTDSNASANSSRSQSQSRSSTATPRPSRSSQSTSSSSLPPRSSSTASGSTRGRPLQPSSQKTSLNPWLSYEDRWHQLLTSSSTSPTAPLVLHFSTIPWPMLNAPTCPTDIRTEAIKAFIFSPQAVRLTTSEGVMKSRRSILRAAILRWHPDKFLGRYLELVEEGERANVKQGVEMVIRGLNEIMRMEAAKERSP
ncbi:hypothetical protein FRB96_002813 [Tulasnella sp. 330]|nr:hypothetical protein FRB96_002813 [Tulasnella sp. 330]KAG8874777.1 hypothetical protein FRB97_005652 [Tulasnella sp. 331]